MVKLFLLLAGFLYLAGMAFSSFLFWCLLAQVIRWMA